MTIKIAIQYYKNNFSDKFVEYCQNNNLSYDLVEFSDNNFMVTANDYNLLLWPWCLTEFETLSYAKELTYSLEKAGNFIYPDFKSSFFYDNKVGQKYIFEAIDVPFVKTDVFFKKQEALKWIENTDFPKVFKLTGGAGSSNVKLCQDKQQAIKLTKQAFGKGFAQIDRKSLFRDSWQKFIEKKDYNTLVKLLKSSVRVFVPTAKEIGMGKEKGYVYFQEFIPNNDFDIRIIVIGDKAIGLKRMCRKDDFRASGSGKIVYDQTQIDIRCVNISFDTSKKLNTQSLCLDFVFDKCNQPLIVEMSYHFSPRAYDKCPGYWTEDLQWHTAEIIAEFMIMDYLLANLKMSTAI